MFSAALHLMARFGGSSVVLARGSSSLSSALAISTAMGSTKSYSPTKGARFKLLIVMAKCSGRISSIAEEIRHLVRQLAI